METIDARAKKSELKVINFLDKKENKPLYFLIYEFQKFDDSLDYIVLGSITDVKKIELVKNEVSKFIDSIKTTDPRLMNYYNERLSNLFLLNKYFEYTKEGYDTLTHKYIFTDHKLIRTVSIEKDKKDSSIYTNNIHIDESTKLKDEHAFMPIEFYNTSYLFNPIEYAQIDYNNIRGYCIANKTKIERIIRTMRSNNQTKDLSKSSFVQDYDILLSQYVDVIMDHLFADKIKANQNEADIKQGKAK